MDRSKMNDPNYVNALWQAGIIKDKSRNNHLKRIEFSRRQAAQYQQVMVNQQREIENLRRQMNEKNENVQHQSQQNVNQEQGN
jgi:hypothetical protein